MGFPFFFLRESHFRTELDANFMYLFDRIENAINGFEHGILAGIDRL